MCCTLDWVAREASLKRELIPGLNAGVGGIRAVFSARLGKQVW